MLGARGSGLGHCEEDTISESHCATLTPSLKSQPESLMEEGSTRHEDDLTLH